ncbi:hypothetical protein [Psychroserpens sp. SPM9]|uniref:hypothetical protein n=1 Tax=Psychroserpens sp. SPM9 TaxID=2975598 RepID=UPI0021A42634|nr:hypothetical protein [Psychroserpens sp. SPM9]MDG5490593.1 hypothetical protein [Psychroserpens sp. SPM9]
MNKNKIIIQLLILLLFQVTLAQEVEIVRETKQLVESRDLYINGGARSQFGGKSRTYIKIDLPPNTVQWYYSFSTSAGKSGTKNLNLAIQLGGILADPTGITSSTISAIDVPEGEASADVYLIDRSNLNLFLDKSEYRHFPEGMAENTKQAVVRIDDIKSGTWYLGIKNPSALNGINLSIEVVAITEATTVKEKSANQEKAELLGALGWKKFENGEYDKCIEYSDKSISEFELGWVKANKGLALIMLGRDSDAMDTYIEAITLIKKQPNPDYIFDEVVKDIDNILRKNPNIVGAKDIREIIELQRN